MEMLKKVVGMANYMQAVASSVHCRTRMDFKVAWPSITECDAQTVVALQI